MIKSLFLLFCLSGLYCFVQAQDCTAPGQNPSTAFPVCGTNKFYQSIVPNCGGRPVPGACSGDGVTDQNPFWYKFTCFESGTLGFLIEPDDQKDDYDWQLFDVTNQDPNDVFVNAALTVSYNWSGNTGNTGAGSSGSSLNNCAGTAYPTFSKMPTIVKGHNYLLLLSHFTTLRPGDKGYKLSFGGGTAVITDTTTPHLKTIEANCEGNQLRIKLSKNIKCNSIAPDGTDFTINSPGISITGVSGFSCNTKFDSDSLLLNLSAPLPPGNYVIGIQPGSDENTLLDYCDNPVPRTDQLNVVITERVPTPMDSLLPVTCAPQQLKLFFKKPIRCASVAADGSNFKLTGTYPVQVVSAGSNCTGDLSKEINLTFSQPLYQAGTFTITLQKDFDGNTIVDECGEETPPGSTLTFSVKDTVSAAFTYTIKYGCVRDTIALFHDGANGVTGWDWNMDDRQRSSQRTAQGLYTVFNQKNINLIVSNGFCSDTASQTVLLENFLKADFTAFEDNCPLEPVTFSGAPQGKILTHLWQFGDGGTATTQTTDYTFQAPVQQRSFSVRYTVTDSFGCQSTATKPITIYPSCYVAVPTAFTPNRDGLNDFLAPTNAVKAINLEFRIYNRWGQLLYASTNWKQGWDGTFKGQPQPTATYVWMLQYTNRDTGKKLQQKGTATLIR